MKIDKVIFSCSEPPAYSSYWNTQSRLYREGLGIEPICLLHGKKDKTDMREDFGRVIEMETIPGLPWAVQMVWSKFDFTRTEPETTWMIGDIDLLPLSSRHFTENIASVPDDWYLNLNAGGISIPRMGRPDGFLSCGSERHGKDGGFIGSDLPAHYHVSKGKNFERLYFAGKTFQQTVEHIVHSGRYGMGILNNYPVTEKENNPYWYYWVAEENYTSEVLWNAIKAGQINYHGFHYCNANERLWTWDKTRNDYVYDPGRVASRAIVDIHCCAVRPYALQAEALERIIALTGLFNGKGTA